MTCVPWWALEDNTSIPYGGFLLALLVWTAWQAEWAKCTEDVSGRGNLLPLSLHESPIRSLQQHAWNWAMTINVHLFFFLILISLHPFLFSVMIAPAGLKAPALRPLNVTAIKVSWDAPAELNGPPPLYHVERTDVSLSDAQGQVIKGRRFTGSGYFRFPSSTLPVNTDFTGMVSRLCSVCLKKKENKKLWQTYKCYYIYWLFFVIVVWKNMEQWVIPYKTSNVY